MKLFTQNGTFQEIAFVENSKIIGETVIRQTHEC